MRTEKERLQDIINAISTIESRTILGKDIWKSDENVQMWIAYHLQIVGEAASALSSSSCRAYAEIDWSQLIGMRNIQIHQYSRIDSEKLWSAAQRAFLFSKHVSKLF